MQHLFESVARAIQERGLRGLLEAVPGGKYAYDIALGAYRFYCERRKLGLFKEELARAAAANSAEVRKVAEEVAQRVAKDAPSEERKALAAYLTQIPNAVRASLKRPEDPFGITVPPTGELPSALDFERVLPQRLPHFREGDAVPGRAGWLLHELLGLGGFGEVWLARHALVPTARAVKFLTDRAARARLAEHEGRVVARVMALGPHPNVVQLLDADVSGECPWLMYEHVPGGSLTELVLSWHALPNAERVTRATSALRQLAEAVGAFHRLAPPVVHRDLKPANVLVAAEGALKVTDFGIGGAVLPEPTLNTGAPLTGRLETALRGSASPLYAGPQQRAGSAPDPRDDVFALGVLAFQMLTGELSAAPGPRFERDLRARGAPADLADLIGDCVDPDADRRSRDAGEVAARLKQPTPPAPLPKGKGETEPDVSLRSASEEAGSASSSAARRISPLPFREGGPGGVGSARSPLEGGSPTFALLPLAEAAEPEPWLVPLVGTWFARAAADAPWEPVARTPGTVVARPGGAYRLALDPATDDAALEHLRALAGMVGLEAVDLTGSRATDAGIVHLAHLRGLKAISLAETRATDAAVVALLARFPDLEALALTGCPRITPAVVPHLLKARKLKVLSLPACADSAAVREEFAVRRPLCRLA